MLYCLLPLPAADYMLVAMCGAHKPVIELCKQLQHQGYASICLLADTNEEAVVSLYQVGSMQLSGAALVGSGPQHAHESMSSVHLKLVAAGHVQADVFLIL